MLQMLQTATGETAAPEQDYLNDLTSDILAALAALAAVVDPLPDQV